MIKLANKLCLTALMGFVALAALTTSAWAQYTGDYQSKASGDWNALSTWERYDGEVWVTPSHSPTSSDGVITILPGHTVTVTADVTIDQTVISSLGQITVASGKTLTIADADGVDLVINGMLTGNGATLIFEAGSEVSLGNDVTLTSCTVTNHGWLEVGCSTFTMQNGKFTNASDGAVEGSCDSFETEGTVTIEQEDGATFDETLTVISGTTTAYGIFLGPITVRTGGTLAIPSGKTLTASCDVMVNQADDERGKTFMKNNTVRLARASVADYGVINGTGNLVLNGYSATFTNHGVVDVATTLRNDGEGLIYFYVEGDGSWKTLTIAAACSTSVYGAHTFTGASTPFVVNGTVSLEEGSTIIYKGSTAQTIAMLDYYNLQIDNPAGVDFPPLSSTHKGTRQSLAIVSYVSVEGALTVTRGDVRTGSNELDLGQYATISETAPYSVIGTLYTSQACTTGYNHDFGGMGMEIDAENVGGWKADKLTATRSMSSVFYVEVTRTTGTALSDTLIKREFDLSVAGVAENATVVFHYATGELNGRTESNLRLYESTDGGSNWTNSGGTVNTGDHTITVAGLNFHESQWIAGHANIPNPTPTLTGVTPSSSTRDRRLSLDLTGTNFDRGTSVAFSGSGITVNSVTFYTSTRLVADITVSASAALGSRSITVANSAGTATLTDGFSITMPAPTLSSVTPNTAHRNDILTVILTGSNFLAGSTSVDFGSGISIDSVSVLGPTQLRGRISVSGAASMGTRDVSVSNPAPGGGTATLTGGFTITNPAAAIRSVTPSAGGRGVATSVTITGTGFVQGVTSLNFGAGISVSSIVVSSATTMTASVSVARDAALGPRDVSVSNPAPGGGSAILTGGFTVQNPVPSVISVSPNTSILGQTLTVTVTGVGFLNGVTVVDFGSGITVNSAVADTGGTHITASIAIAAGTTAGERTVTATNPGPGGGPGTLPGGFIVTNPVPTLTSINPAVGGKGQTLNVALVGTNFVGATSASFGPGVTVNSVVINSQTSLSASITIAGDAVAAARSVGVTNPTPGGGTATLPFAFNVQNAAPTLTSVSPSLGTRGQTLNVTLSGTGFYAGVTTVSSGPGITINSTTVNGLTQMTVGITVAPDAAIGPRDFVATNPAPGGGTATLAGSFTVAYPVPTLTSLSPNSGTRSQTPTVTLAGSGFYSGVTTVSFGAGITISSITVNSLTQMTVGITVAPDAAMGPRDVSVTNPAPGGGTATLAGSFTVANPVPTITSVTPVSAGRGSLLKVTVAGTQFIDAVTSLTFGTDISVTNFSVKSSTEIQANIAINPAATPGTRTVTVTNAAPGGGPASLTNGFTITSAPATSIEGDLGIIPDQYALQEAYPNPFNPSTRIRYGVSENSRIRLIVHNMLGNIVAELINGERSKGTYELQWHADNLPSGVYLIRMNAESLESTKRFIASRKVVLVK